MNAKTHNPSLPFRPSVLPEGSFEPSAHTASGKLWIALLCLLGFVRLLHAEPIVFTFSGTGSGDLGGTRFTDSIFTFQIYGDTASAPSIPDSFSTFEIGTAGSGLFLPDMRVRSRDLLVNGTGSVALGLNGIRDLLLVSGTELLGYDLTTSHSPVTFASAGGDPIERFREIPTSVGPLSLFSAREVTFSATLVPEPSSIALVAMATLSLFIGSRALRKSR